MSNQQKVSVSRVVTGIVDVIVQSGKELNIVGLVPNCGGALDNNLGFITDGTVVILRRGRIMKKVTLRVGDASECVANVIQVSTALARKFGLRNRTRFCLTYNTATKTLTMRRKRVTLDNLLLTADPKLSRDQVAIGLGLARRDGNYLKGGELITLRHGIMFVKRRFVLLTENDVFNNDFKLNPRVIRLLGLKANKNYRISYNQVKRELVFIRQIDQ